MREILFRGKSKSNDKYYFFATIWRDNCKDGFVYGSLIVQADRYYICVSTVGVKMNCSVNNSTVSIIEVIPETVGQYTGLNDKNGNKIFEGDIIKHHFEIGVVKFGSYETPHIGFYINWITLHYRKDIGFWQKEIKVIDNIHDNPELLNC